MEAQVAFTMEFSRIRHQLMLKLNDYLNNEPLKFKCLSCMLGKRKCAKAPQISIQSKVM